MAMPMDQMKTWIEGLVDDAKLMERLVELPGVPKDARTLAAAALCYLVSRLDLVPDWEKGAGVLDDAMVIRVAAALAADKGLGEPPVEILRELSRLANEAETVAEFLGPPLYARFKAFVEELMAKEVRGRFPATIVEDAKARQLLFAEVEDEVRRASTAPPIDAEAVGRMVKNAIGSKLKA